MQKDLISKDGLERKQVPIYAAGLLLGAAIGLVSPATGSALEAAIYPVLGILLYATFLQVPFSELRSAAASGRFLAAMLVLNFLFVPVVVLLLSRFVAGEPAVFLGVLLVLLTPCIDYVIVFSELGGSDSRKVLAATPVLMLTQLVTLPLYLWLFIGTEVLAVFSAGPFLEAFLVLIVLPLGLAIGTQYLKARESAVGSVASRWDSAMGYLPVPFLAFTLLAVVASQIPKPEGAFGQVVGVVPIYVAFLVIMALLGRLTARLFSLDVQTGRALIFTGATRNSLVVLPLALALPDAYALTPAIVVTQTLVELVGMLVYIRLVPAWVLPYATILSLR
jgi:ACR3 family arsenite efflux pump ArsB